MTPNQRKEIKRLQRAANLAFARADINGREDHPWSLRNMRVWQGVACQFLDLIRDIHFATTRDAIKQASDLLPRVGN